jgi:hypothetical protein
VEQEGLAGVLERVDVVAEEAGRLAFGEERRDRRHRGVGPGAVPVGPEQEAGQFIPLREEVELAPEEAAQPLHRRQADERDPAERAGELGGGAAEGRLVEGALGPEVVVEELLVDPGPPGDGVGAGPREAVPGELVTRGGEEEVGRRGAPARQGSAPGRVSPRRARG